MDKKSVAKNYRFLAILLSCMVAGALLGWFRPKWGHSIAFLGTVFINMMFCVVVPLVFASVAGSVASMGNMRRAGQILGITVTVFVATGTIAAIIMFALMKVVPPVLAPWQEIPAGEMGEYASLPDLLVNFFTVGDFAGLLSRKAMLPLIVPIFLSAFKRADELAMAMEARCYHGGEGRTALHVLRFRPADLWVLAGFAALTAGVIALGRLGI